jgi:hypothetical protein
MLQPQPSYVGSRTVVSNCRGTPNTCFNFSEPFPFRTAKLSTWTRPSGATQGKLSISSYPTLEDSVTLKPDTSKMMERETGVGLAKKRRSISQTEGPTKFAGSGIVGLATGERQNVGIDIFAPPVEEVTQTRNVRRRIETSKDYLRPKFARDFIWGPVENDISPAAFYSLTAAPLPRPPQSELDNIVANNTIRDHPDLFAITCNINIPRFKQLLRNHPNQAFVRSVIEGLTEGFWPWAEQPEDYPITHREPQHPPRTETEREFMRTQRLTEIQAGRFSPPFKDLLPGMHVVPVHAIPKAINKLRLIVDHSAGIYSINSMIDRQDIAGVKLDGIKTLGDSIRAFRSSEPMTKTCPLILWKSDVAAAYRQMPMHPLWQIKQAVCIDDQFSIDRCNNFGGRASQKIWWSFMSLVLWIAVFERSLRALKCYVDDNFSVCLSGDLEFYEKYETFLPSDQARLLELWDEIGLPHEQEKQISGACIPIIGFEVDPNAMTVQMKEDKKTELIDACAAFTVRGARKTLREFQRLQGWVNWALNVFPHLRPALCESYNKIAGKERPNASIRVNNAMRRELLWLIDHIKRSDGIHMLKSVEWSPYDRMASTLIGYSDASGLGMGVWFPGVYAGFQCSLPPEGPKDLIFFYEALAICSAFHLGAKYGCDRIGIYSDNTNAVDMFSSLRAKPIYNSVLMCAIDFTIDTSISTKAYFVPGNQNVIADYLSRFQNEKALALAPKLQISTFEPPRDALGVAKK